MEVFIFGQRKLEVETIGSELNIRLVNPPRQQKTIKLCSVPKGFSGRINYALMGLGNPAPISLGEGTKMQILKIEGGDFKLTFEYPGKNKNDTKYFTIYLSGEELQNFSDCVRNSFS